MNTRLLRPRNVLTAAVVGACVILVLILIAVRSSGDDGHEGASFTVGDVQASIALFDDPIDADAAREHGGVAEPNRQCLELRIGDRIPMRNCTTPRSDGPLVMGAGALFSSGSDSTLMVVAAVDAAVDRGKLVVTGSATPVASTVPLPDRPGRVLAFELPCDSIAACAPQLVLHTASGEITYRIEQGEDPFGTFVMGS